MIMNRKILILYLALMVLPLVAVAQHYTEAQARQRINRAAQSMTSMRCDFTQTKSLKLMRSNVVSRGVMYYSRPNKLRWEYTSPYRYTFLLNGQTVVLKDTKGTSRIDANQSKMMKEITRIMMSSVVGTCVNDSRDFKVVLSGSGNSWRAVMTPRRNPMKQMFQTITVGFDMQRQVVTSVRMVEKNGDTTTIQLNNVKTNTPIDAKVFSLH